MNSLFAKNHVLLSGTASPATGSYVNAAKARTMSLTVRATGVNGPNTLRLFAPSPFPGDTTDVEFMAVTIAANGHYHYQVTGVPVPSVKVGTQGNTGFFWVNVLQQN